MKLATYKDGSRDGQLLVVSRDLSQAHFASGIASRLQAVLDDWNFLSPQLEDLYATLNGGKARHAFALDPALCMAPLPRAGLWAFAPAVAEPVLTCQPADHFLGPHDPVVLPANADGLRCEPGLVAATGDIPLGSPPAQALEGVRLLMLCQVWRMRTSATDGLSVATAFAPLAVTPDELGPAWRGGRAERPLQARHNGKPVPLAVLPRGLQPHFGALAADLARVRRLSSGGLVGAALTAPAAPDLPPLQAGDRWRIEMTDNEGLSVFGAIEQRVDAA